MRNSIRVSAAGRVFFSILAAFGCGNGAPADGGGSGGASGAGSGGAMGGNGGAGAGTGGTGTGGAPMVDAGGSGGSVDAGADRSGGSDGGAVGSGCAAPGTICWDFEQGALPSGFTPYRNEFVGTLVVDNTRPHRGMFSLHAKDLRGGVEGQQGGPKKTARFNLPAGFGPIMWGRAFVYTTPARPTSHAGIFNARYPRPDAPTGDAVTIEKLDWYEVATYTQKYMTVWHPPEPPGYPEWVQVADTPLVLDGWACLEWLFDGANGDAAQAADPRMWLDGVELTWPAPFVFSDPATTIRPAQEKAQSFTVLEVGAYLYQGLPTTTNWWIDDLGVGKERIGCD